jgi:phospholipase A1/A2
LTRFAFALLISIASAGICAQSDKPAPSDKAASEKAAQADKQEKSDKPAEWVIATSDVNVFAGERFEILVVSLAGEPLPDEIEVRMKVGPEERITPLAAASPPSGSRRSYAGTVPAGVTGPVALDLPGRASSVLVLMVAASRADPVQAFVTRRVRAGVAAEPPLSENDPMYFIIGPRGGYSARFQLSLKYRLFDQSAGLGQDRPWLSGFYFGYTQNSVWDLSEQSKPFRDTSYRPSFFWKWERADDRTWIDGFRVGAEHESNGGGIDRSRSIDILFVRPDWRWTYADDSKFEFTPKIYGYLDKSDNPDIDRYRGNVDWRVRYDSGHNWLGTAVARVGSAGHGSLLLDVSRRVRDLRFGPVGGYLHFQYFNGYGEDILDYNLRRKWQFRIGFAIVP